MSVRPDEQCRLPFAVTLPDHVVRARHRRPIGSWPGQKAMAREDLVDLPHQLSAPRGEDHEVVADSLEIGDDVGREDDGQPRLCHRLHHRLEEFAARKRIERRNGLIEDQQLGTLRQGERERDLSLLSAGELSDLLSERKVEPLEPR